MISLRPLMEVAPWDSCIGCIGVFDGVHLGHQSVLSQAAKRARECEVPAVLVTFDRNPLEIIAPGKAPTKIASLESNMVQAAKCGIDAVVIVPFTRDLAAMDAQDFYDQYLTGQVKSSQFVVGHDFAMGRGRAGTAQWLADRAPTVIVDAVSLDGERVSSSAVRAAITAGKVENALRLLGRPFELEGIVGGGLKLGRQLGYPTANLKPQQSRLIPADGIYAGEAGTPFGVFKAAISIGIRPTIGGEDRAIEAFLLDYPGDSLYGRPLELRFHRFLRSQIHFDNVESLKAQMKKDIKEVAL